MQTFLGAIARKVAHLVNFTIRTGHLATCVADGDMVDADLLCDLAIGEMRRGSDGFHSARLFYSCGGIGGSCTGAMFGSPARAGCGSVGLATL